MAETLATAGTPARASGPHLAHVEGLRALAAYVVYINHAYGQVWNPRLDEFPPSFLSLFTYSLVAGHLSVTVFIVVSGFCLMLPVVRGGNQLRGGARGFFQRRSRRILPPYYGALALCIVLIWTILGERTGTLWDVPIMVKQNKISILYHLLLIQDFFGTSKINYVFWSIAVEWHIYFLFPLMVLAWRRLGPSFTVSAALVVGYALRFGLGDTRVARAAPQYLGLFALGMLAAHVIQSTQPSAVRARDRFPWAPVGIACVALVVFLSRLWGWGVAADRFHILDLPIGVAAMCLLVVASRDKESLSCRLLSWKPLVFIGTFSYSVYLVHAPLLQILWQYVLHPAQLSQVAMFAALMGPGALVILAAAYGFFRVCEEPFLSQRPAARAPSGVPAAAPAGEKFAPVAIDDRRVP